MEIKITQAAIMRALDKTNLEFDTAVVYKLLDKMPTIYRRVFIQELYFTRIRPDKPAYVLEVNDVSYVFPSWKELVEYSEANNIYKERTLKEIRYSTKNMKNPRRCKCKVYRLTSPGLKYTHEDS